MTITDRQYTVAAFCEILQNNVDLRLAWEAISLTTTGKEFDDAIQAAIHAEEWLNKLTR